MKATTHMFKALGDETRLRIMALLISGQELCVCDIMNALDLPQSTASRHLAYLRSAGLVDDRRQGVWMYYKLDRKRLKHASSVFQLLSTMFFDLEQIAEDQDSLKEYLTTKNQQLCS